MRPASQGGASSIFWSNDVRRYILVWKECCFRNSNNKKKKTIRPNNNHILYLQDVTTLFSSFLLIFCPQIYVENSSEIRKQIITNKKIIYFLIFNCSRGWCLKMVNQCCCVSCPCLLSFVWYRCEKLAI